MNMAKSRPRAIELIEHDGVDLRLPIMGITFVNSIQN